MSAGPFGLEGALSEALASGEGRAVLFDRSTSTDPEIRDATSSIIERVRRSGDKALRELGEQFDAVVLDSLEVPTAALRQALDSLPAPLRRAMDRAADNIARFHSDSIPAERIIEVEPGVLVGRRPDPFDCVGVYAPGGRASYPSSVLMGAIPARCAGVREIVLCSPPGADGAPPRTVLAAAGLADVDRVFSVGGAGAVAAMALGTKSVPRVQKIVGPGNAYVAEAKLQLSGVVAIDSPAGPSELLVIADSGASAVTVAREVLAQAEHDPRAVVAVVCESEELARSVALAVAAMIKQQPRREIITAALSARGALLWSNSQTETVAFANEFAPEHLLIATSDADDICRSIRNAGTIFVGEFSSVAFGDYMTGANHVLPTGGLARNYSGLSTLDFVRWTTHQHVSRIAARSLAEDVGVFASAENLPAHSDAARAWGDA